MSNGGQVGEQVSQGHGSSGQGESGEIRARRWSRKVGCRGPRCHAGKAGLDMVRTRELG